MYRCASSSAVGILGVDVDANVIVIVVLDPNRGAIYER